jgi:hypothetical protein
MEKFTKFAGLLALALVLASCSSPKVALNVQRAPTLNTSGIQRVAVMPFESARHGYQAVAKHATSVAAGKIQATNNFTLVSYAMVEPRRRAGQSFDDLVDALFTGQIMNIDEKSDCSSKSYTDKKGETTVHTTCIREVQVEFNYSFIRSRDGTIIGPVAKKGSASASSDNMGGLPSIEALAINVVDAQMAYMHRGIAPYTVTVTRPLAKESDKALQPQMEAALAHVNSGNYIAARDAYISIYDISKSMAAAENASIILEALGETKAAADLIQRVAAETGNPRAREILARLNMELQQTAAVGEFKAKDSRSPAEKVAKIAFEETQKHFPDSARVWIINNSAAENVLINNVIDNMAAAFLKNGITIVDRQNTALVQAEQRFQMSGHVNDDDIVGIGNMAGVNRVIILSVIGSGPLRRLQVRVLDVQRGILLMQSDTDEKWSL